MLLTVNDMSLLRSETVDAVVPCSKSLCGSTLIKEKDFFEVGGQPGQVNDVLSSSSEYLIEPNQV